MNEQTIREFFDQVELDESDKFQSYANLEQALDFLIKQAFIHDCTELVTFIYQVHSEKINSIGTNNDYVEYLNSLESNQSSKNFKKL